MSSYRFSSLAIAEIASYIFDLNPVGAENFLNSLGETCELLVRHPYIGRSRSEFGEDIRSFPVGNYLIFYKPALRGIDVARVIYGGRDLPAQFSGSN